MKHILLPTDFSSKASTAFNYAIHIAQQTGAWLTIFHAHHVPIMQHENRQYPLLTLLETLEHLPDTAEFLQAIQNTHPLDILEQVKIHYLLTDAIDNEAIFQLLNDKKYTGNFDLLLINVKEENVWTEWFGGSELQKLLQHQLSCPVLAIPELATYHPIQKIAYATALQAPISTLKQLQNMGRLLNATIKFVHVITEKTRSYDTKLQAFTQRVQQVFEDKTFKIIELKDRHVEEALTKYIEEQAINMLSLIERPKSIFDRLFLNSITQDMAHEATVPILILFDN